MSENTSANPDTNWLDRKEFANMDPLKKKILSDFILSAENKSIPQAIPLLMRTKEEFKKNHLVFTEEESALIFEILSIRLKPEEREKLRSLGFH